MSEQAIDARCPACGNLGLRMRTATTDVPYFGECMETVVLCDRCNFRHADFIILSQKEPTRHAFAMQASDDLAVRVVRSNSCTIRLPELGFVAEPTPRSEAFVSNVQGVLDRIRDVILTARVINSDDPELVRVAEEKLGQLARIESLQEPATLILDDPFGNSAILSDRTDVRALTPEEVADLETGYVVFDKDELAR